LSTSSDLTSSILQRSGLGPLLFVTEINELVTIFVDYNAGVKLFADDLKIYATLSSSIEAHAVCFIVRARVGHFVAAVCVGY